jgi:2-polyprenyl-3-methyl-5-hydroxy-6-metoxy-1,4-benzoquinol methylase
MNSHYSDRQLAEKLYHDDKYRHHVDTGTGGMIMTRPYQRFWDLIGSPKGQTILDFGCGNGWLSVMLARLGNTVHGIDISGVLIGMANQLAATSNLAHSTSFKEMAAEDLDFPEGSFDMIIGTSILHHTDLDVTLSKIRRVLKADGTAIFLEPLNQNIALRLWRLMTPWRRTATERAFTKEDLANVRRVFPQARFNYFCFTSMFSGGLLVLTPRSRIAKFVNDRLEAFDEWLLGSVPGLGRFSAVVIMEMRK